MNSREQLIEYLRHVIKLTHNMVDILSKYVDDVESYKEEREKEMVSADSFIQYIRATFKKEAAEEIMKMLSDEIDEFDFD